MNLKDLPTHPILDEMKVQPDLLVYSGSRLYGTDGPNSDYDIRGIVVPAAEYTLGTKQFDQAIMESPVDYVVYSLQKAFKLWEKGSINQAEMLFAPPDKVIHQSDVGRKILQNRNIFISKQWITPLVAFAISEWEKCQRSYGDAGEFNYKSASHAVRLLYQGKELLEYHKIMFPCVWAQLFKEIKRGDLSYDECEYEYNLALTCLRNAEATSTLRTKSDKAEINELYYQLISPSVTKFLKVYQ